MAIRIFCFFAVLLLSMAANAQTPGLPTAMVPNGGGGSIVGGATPVTGTCPDADFLYNNSGVVGCSGSSSSIDFPQATTGGTSGGIAYFSAATTLSASALLAAGEMMQGGGAGTAPSTFILGGDCTFSTPNITCTKTSGTAFGALATLGIGAGLGSSGGNLNLSTPVSAANGGSGVASPTAHAVLLGEGSSAFGTATIGTSGRVLVDQGAAADPLFKAVSGDCTFAASGAITCTKTSGTSFGALATLGVGTGLDSSAGNANLDLTNANSWTGTQTFSGTSSALAAILTNAAEPATVSATAATGTINFDFSAQSVIYYTSDASANWTVNFRFSSGTALNSVLSTGQAITGVFLVTQGASPFYNNSVEVDGTTSGVTTVWLGGAPSGGNASGVDVYSYSIIKTGSAAYSVFASLNQYK